MDRVIVAQLLNSWKSYMNVDQCLTLSLQYACEGSQNTLCYDMDIVKAGSKRFNWLSRSENMNRLLPSKDKWPLTQPV